MVSVPDETGLRTSTGSLIVATPNPLLAQQDSAPFGGSLGVILYPILLVLEPIRLYLGWSGNLSETVRPSRPDSI